MAPPYSDPHSLTPSPPHAEAPVAPDSVDEGTVFRTDQEPRLQILIPLVVACGLFMENLDSTAINTAIPQMAHSLNEAPLHLTMAITAYLLSQAVFIPISGWIADRFGARNVFCVATAIFTIGSMLCGMADSLGMLVVTRAVQGMGGALMTPVGRLIMLRSFPRSQLIRTMNYVTIPALIGPTIGPIVGGFLTTYASWRWIFYVNVPVGIAAVVLAWRYAENFRARDVGHFDFRGFALCAFCLACLQFGLEAIGRDMMPVWAIVVLLTASATLAALYWFHARRLERPAFDIAIFKVRTFRIVTLWGGLSRLALGGMPFLIPLLLQLGFGYSAVASGFNTFLIAVGAIALKGFLRVTLRHFGYRNLLMGNSVIMAVMTIGMIGFQASSPAWLLAGYILLFGISRSLAFSGMNTLSYADVSTVMTSRATSVASIAQQLTVNFGVVFASCILSLISGGGAKPTLGSFDIAFLLDGLLMLLPIIGFMGLRADDGALISGHRAKAPAE